jgi:hypothetical protein
MIKGDKYFNKKALEEAKKLIISNIPVKEQIIKFTEICNLSEKTFYRYKKYLLQQNPDFRKYRQRRQMVYGGSLKESCYFCNQKATNIHHLDTNRENNNINNLVPLCRACHTKIHLIYNNLLQSDYFFNIKNKTD